MEPVSARYPRLDRRPRRRYDDDDGGTDHNARVYFDCDTAGTYYLAAGGYGTSQGTYTLSVADVTDGEPDDFSAGTDTTGAVDVGGSVSGHLELWHDRDWFAVELEAGRFYSIALKGSWTGDNTLYDPVCAPSTTRTVTASPARAATGGDKNSDVRACGWRDLLRGGRAAGR